MESNLRRVFVGPCPNARVRSKVKKKAEKLGVDITFVRSVFDADILVLTPGWETHPMSRSLIDAQINLNLGSWSFAKNGKIEIADKDRTKPPVWRYVDGLSPSIVIFDELTNK